MAFYLVRARPRSEKLAELYERLDRGDFLRLRPFGRALTRSLAGARRDLSTGEALWEEEDYCTPPLAQEREAVLDGYFDDIRVEPVEEGAGWERIAGLKPLWDG